jgi:hypothetical protein
MGLLLDWGFIFNYLFMEQKARWVFGFVFWWCLSLLEEEQVVLLFLFLLFWVDFWFWSLLCLQVESLIVCNSLQ